MNLQARDKSSAMHEEFAYPLDPDADSDTHRAAELFARAPTLYRVNPELPKTQRTKQSCRLQTNLRIPR
jgi:hypothetical protein